MPYVLTIATPEGRDLVVAALRAEADKRTRVARGAAQHVAADKLAGGRDVRSSAVRVAMLLAEAGQLADLADELAAATELAVLSVAADGALRTAGIPEPKAGDATAVVVDPLRPGLTAQDLAAAAGVPDDGLSDAAHRAAELAGLEDAYVDPDGEDVETGATAEDDPDEVEEVLK